MSINQSSNTLFHFTKDNRKHPGIENIISILKNGFEPRFCKEDLNFLFSEPPQEESIIRCIPMVCFCDIPLSHAKDHMDNYSNYGIGLTKEWGIENGINPVLYLSPIQKNNNNSFFERILQILKNTENRDEKFGIFNMIKPYEGKVRKNGKDIRFYDEREWRFLPNIPYNTSYRNCRNSNKKERFNKELKPLDFQSLDIKYIIVSNQDEMSRVWDEINKIEKYSSIEKKSLCCKVISAQTIEEDF